MLKLLRLHDNSFFYRFLRAFKEPTNKYTTSKRNMVIKIAHKVVFMIAIKNYIYFKVNSILN